MQSAKVKIRTYEGLQKEVEKLQIYAETDQKGEVFIKVSGIAQGEIYLEQCTILVEYSKEKAIKKISKLLSEVLDKQIEELKK